jgi:serine/threonine-protein kinase
LRSIDELEGKLVPGTNESLTDPFFSPDGKWIGYWSSSSNQLKKISINGGAPVLIAHSEKPSCPIWYPDDTIVYGQSLGGLFRVSANGGTPERLVESKGDDIVAVPRILPDKKSIMFTLIKEGGTSIQVAVQSLKSGERKILFAGDNAQYLSSGHIIYALQNNLMAVRFDLNKLEVVGGPVPMIEGMFRAVSFFAPQYAISDSGTLVYAPGMTAASAGPSPRTLVWVDRNGKEEPIPAAPNSYNDPRISPDGTRVALNVPNTDGNRDIWIWDLARKTLTRLTFGQGFNRMPLWTTDGKRIVYDRSLGFGTYLKAADGTGHMEPHEMRKDY